MATFFDSRDEACRSPFGAVSSGTAVFFRVRVPRDWGCRGVTLHVERDGCLPEELAMFWAGLTDETGQEEWWDIHYAPAAPGVYFYTFALSLALGDGWLHRLPDGKAAYSPDTNKPMWQLTCYAPDFTTPDWLAGGVMAQIFPDRFFASGKPKAGVLADRRMHADWQEEVDWRPDARGEYLNDDYFGGDLPGITEKLDYLASLGVNCLYLNPIFEAHSNHRYNTADYSRIDPLLGTEEDFRTLTAEAAKRGIRVILDGVFSHTGADSVYFNREGRYPTPGAWQSLASPYGDWYRFSRWPEEYASWWGFKTLPEVEETAPSYLNYIAGEDGIVPYWQRAGAAGWRLDVADELPDAFLDAFRRRVKATDPEALVLGEVWEDASHKESYGHRRRYLLGDQLDSVMNYPFREAVLDAVRTGEAGPFFDRVLDIAENYPPQVLRLLMNPLSTHDTERALTVLGGEPAGGRGRSWQAAKSLTPQERTAALRRLRLAALLQYALPGVPCLYYGDEAGMEGYRDPFNRRPYPWGKEEPGLPAWFAGLGQLRRSLPCFAEAPFIPLEGAIAFYRGDGFLCAVNASEEEMTLSVQGECIYAAGEVNIAGAIRLGALSGGWFKPE